VFYFSYLCVCDPAEKLGESWRLQEANPKDPLLASVDVLESNWKLARDILQRIRHVLIHLFVRFWLKKKEEMPADNIRKVVTAFDTIQDPIRVMNRMLVKRGVKGSIALALSHGKEVDWEKVGASYDVPLVQMMEFFKKAKEYTPKLVSLILPLAAPLTTATGPSTPSSSAPAVDASAPSSATDPAIDVA
jgi:hypothetical protein